MTTMVSCTQENVMLETTPQVKNQEVRFCFFESSIVPIGQDEETFLSQKMRICRLYKAVLFTAVLIADLCKRRTKRLPVRLLTVAESIQ